MKVSYSRFFSFFVSISSNIQLEKNLQKEQIARMGFLLFAR